MKQMRFYSVERTGRTQQSDPAGTVSGEMEQAVPWARLLAVLEPHYYVSGKFGRPLIPLERMLRMYFVQQWYSLADEALEDALYDSPALRDFVGIDLSRQSVSGATTLLHFRHRLERESLTKTLFAEINAYLEQLGLLLHRGTLVDAMPTSV